MKKRILSLLLSMVLTIGLLPFAASAAAAADTTANFTNLVIFCRFSDENEDFIHTEYANTKVLDIIDNTYNTSSYSVADYFRTVSGGKMKMQTLYLLDKDGASLQLSQPRGYYAKQTADNPIGFGSGGGSLRISELMQDWGTAVNAAIAAGAVPVDAAGNRHTFAELDKDGDGKIDLMTVIYKNTEQTNFTVEHADPLWDYHYTYNGVSAQEGDRTYTSNHYVQLTCNYTNSNGLVLYQDGDGRVILGTHGKICHETTHGLGLLDLYSGTSDANKVGYMSLMSKHTSPMGQFLSAKEREALGWLDGQVQTMTGSGSYTLLPADSTTGTVAYKVDLSTGKTLYLEYRQFDQPSNRYDYYKKEITYIASGLSSQGAQYKSGLVCYLATTDRSIPSSGDLEVVSAGQQDTKTDCAVGLNETLRDKIYSNGQWIDITVTAMDADSLTFSITGLPGSAEKTLSSLAISGGTSMTVPTKASGAATLALTATATYSDTSSADVTDAAAWSLAEAYAGVSVSGGVVTVAPDAAAGSVIVQAEYQGKQDTHTILLTAAKEDTTPGVTIAADKNGCTYGYAEADAPTFTAAVTGAAAGAHVTCRWYVDNAEQPGETGSSFTFPAGRPVNTYAVKCEVAVDGHTVTSNEVIVTVHKAAPVYTVPTAKTGLIYSGMEQTLITAGSTNGGTLQYSLNGTDWSAELPAGKSADTYTVSYKVVGDDNYADVAESSIHVAIAQRPVTVGPKSYAITGGDAIPAFALEYDGLVAGDTLNSTATPAFTCCETDGQTAVSTSTAAGSYTITWTNADDFHFDDEPNYTVTKETTGTLTINNKPSSGGGSSSGGGGSSSGGGGSSSGSNNTAITVPVSSDSASVEVKAEVSKGNATVEVSDKQIEKVAANGAGSVTLDVSGLKNVESATVPSHVVEKTNEAENTGLTVALPAGSVTLDETALGSVTENAKGKDVTVSVTTVAHENLTEAQKKAIGDTATVAVVVDVNIIVGNSKQSSFDGGKLTISVPYTPKAGEDTSKLTVWFIRDDGTIENKGGWYDAEKKCFVFETEHLSQYLLVHANEVISFTDVPQDAYYAAAVLWAANKGITGGVTGTTFAPDAPCTRAQIVTFLWRAAGSPEPKTTSSFADVPADAYYAKAVAWAVEQGITTGVGSNQFAPDLTCARAQAAAFLYRHAQANGGGFTGAWMFRLPFTDVPEWCYESVAWCCMRQITNGTSGTTFSPDGACTRAQIATMLYRLLGD